MGEKIPTKDVLSVVPLEVPDYPPEVVETIGFLIKKILIIFGGEYQTSKTGAQPDI